MSTFTRVKNQFLARLATRVPALAQRFIDSYQARQSGGEIPWTTPLKPLSESKLALVTTSGIHHGDQRPFDMLDKNGDPSYRKLNGETLFDDYKISHDYYDHTDAHIDPNIIFPLDRLRELVSEGVIGKLAASHYAFMGHIDGGHIDTLVNTTAKEVAQKLKEDDVELVLLTPA